MAPVADRPLRVLMAAACPFPAPQGSQVYVAGLAGALARAGVEVRLLTYPGGTGATPAGIRHIACRGIGIAPRIRAGPWVGKFPLNRRLSRALREEIASAPPDLIHAHNIEALRIAAPLARAQGIPLIYGMHGLMERELPAYFRFAPLRWAARRIGRRLDLDAVQQAGAFHTLCPSATQALIRLGATAERILESPPGIDLEAFDAVAPRMPDDSPGAQCRPLAVYGGNLDGYQDLKTLRRAFALLRQAAPLARLVLASHAESGPYDDVRDQWSKEPEVQFIRVHGLAEMKALLFAADILVNPRSTPGGFPVKLLNYMAVGRAIVSCRGSAGPLEHERDALLAPDGDAKAFAACLKRLAHDAALRHHLGRAARERVERECRWERRAEEMLAFYRQILAS
ncbi:MAG: glycosyltransferase family 4 protein [Candidatus Sumerlaeota bacterium]|nr:glycosyltransferase family 4 protein [Candidatus Sumerlaeota bacterium]